MRLLLLSLCSLLLYASVTSHPVTRHRGGRVRNPLNQITPDPDASVPGKESNSVDEDSSAVVDIAAPHQGTTSPPPRRPITAMFRRREDRGRCSEDKSGSRRGSNGKFEDDEDWLDMIRMECGMKLEMLHQLEKVAPTDVENVMTSADETTKKIADSFSQHRDKIAELEANMKGQSVDQLVSSHIVLLEQFGSLVESAMKNGMCEFESMKLLLDKIANLGSTDFADSRCNEAYQMVTGFDSEPEYAEMNAREYVTLMWLLRFGEALRNDMYCIINDIEALSGQISSLRNIFKFEQNPSIRYIHIGLSTAMAYEGIIENELYQFRHAIDLVGDALQHVNLQELEAQAMPMRKRDRILKAMKRLRKA